MAAAQQFSQLDAPAGAAEQETTVGGLPGMNVAGIASPTIIVAGQDLSGRTAELVDLAIPNREIPRPDLTAREQDVLLCWLTSDSKTAVSTALGLSDGTVKTHLHRIRGKYEAVGRNASTKAALVARALQDGLIRLEDL